MLCFICVVECSCLFGRLDLEDYHSRVDTFDCSTALSAKSKRTSRHRRCLHSNPVASVWRSTSRLPELAILWRVPDLDFGCDGRISAELCRRGAHTPPKTARSKWASQHSSADAGVDTRLAYVASCCSKSQQQLLAHALACLWWFVRRSLRSAFLTLSDVRELVDWNLRITVAEANRLGHDNTTASLAHCPRHPCAPSRGAQLSRSRSGAAAAQARLVVDPRAGISRQDTVQQLSSWLLWSWSRST